MVLLSKPLYTLRIYCYTYILKGPIPCRPMTVQVCVRLGSVKYGEEQRNPVGERQQQSRWQRGNNRLWGGRKSGQGLDSVPTISHRACVEFIDVELSLVVGICRTERSRWVLALNSFLTVFSCKISCALTRMLHSKAHFY